MKCEGNKLWKHVVVTSAVKRTRREILIFQTAVSSFSKKAYSLDQEEIGLISRRLYVTLPIALDGIHYQMEKSTYIYI